MKYIKITSILLITLFMFCSFIPQANAKRHHHRWKSRSSFGMSFNVAQPRYVVAPAPVAVMPYQPVVAPAPVYYYPNYCAPAPVIVERPAPSVWFSPGFSFSFWN